MGQFVSVKSYGTQVRVGLSLFSILGSELAHAQTLETASDRLLRSAYCSGVLVQQEETLSSSFAKQPPCETAWRSQGFESLNVCKERRSAYTKMMLGDRENKRRRYVEYLELFLPELGTGFGRLMALIEKGRRDAWVRNESLDARCSKSCPLVDQGVPSLLNCVLPCIEQEDQQFANVLHCVYSPDRLPF